MTSLCTLATTLSGLEANAPEAAFILLLAFVILAGSMLAPLIKFFGRLMWLLVVVASRAVLHYAIDKVLDTVFWGAVGIIGALLFWG